MIDHDEAREVADALIAAQLSGDYDLCRAAVVVVEALDVDSAQRVAVVAAGVAATLARYLADAGGVEVVDYWRLACLDRAARAGGVR